MPREYSTYEKGEQYARDILSGKIVSCYYVKRACERYFYDHEHAAEKGIYFDEAAANKAVKYLENLKHFKGEWAGKFMILSPWQVFGIMNIFGWKWKKTGYRRFRHAYNEVARKNGKTQIAGGVGLMGATADGEHGAEVYSAATKIEQARIAWNAAVKMIKQDKYLDSKIKTNTRAISYLKNFSKYEPICSDSKTSDGFDPHMGIFDETHAWETDDMAEVIISGMGSRRQPLIYEITTAGFDEESYAYGNRELLVQILDGFDKPDGLINDSFWGIIYTLDKEDIDSANWQNEEIWIKANPNLGISPKIDYIREECKLALQKPRKMPFFLTKNMNVWTKAKEKWLNMQCWSSSGNLFNIEDLIGRDCYGGLDLASHKDLAADALVFPPAEGETDYKYVVQMYTPSEMINQNEKEMKIPLSKWIEDGHIIATPGMRIDNDMIVADILKNREMFNILGYGYDPWAASEIIKKLEEEGMIMVMIPQNFKALSAATKEFELRLIAGEISHNNNPALRWCCSNAVVKVDDKDNMCPSKKLSRAKIDGLAACINADAVSRAEIPEADTPSIYENKEPEIL